MQKGCCVSATSRWVASLLLAGGLVMMSGCTSLGGAGATPEEIVAKRAVARWQAVIAGDWESAYSYATSAYRAAVNLESYKGRIAGPVIRKAAEAKSVSCQESSCEVVLRMTYEPAGRRGFGELTTEFSERWVEEDGRWYIFQRF